MSEQQITLKKQRLPFTQVPNELLCSNKISGMAKALWCVLYSKPENWTFYWSEISKNFKEGREALMTARNHLEDAGYIKITQKRIPTGKGKETRYGGMDIELFHTPSSSLDLEPEQSSQTAGFPTTGLPTSGTQQSGDQISGDEPSGKPPLERKKKQDINKEDLYKKYLSNFISLPLEEKIDFVKKIFEKKFPEFKSSPEGYCNFRERKKGGWNQVGNLEEDLKWWEGNFRRDNPKLYEEKPTLPKTETVQESEEIKKLRHEIKAIISRDNEKGYLDNHEYFSSAPIEKTLFGYTIKVSDKVALKYEEVLRKINVKVEMV